MSPARSASYGRPTRSEAIITSAAPIRPADPRECVETFAWRGLRFHVVTAEPLTAEQIDAIGRTVPRVTRVGMFAQVVAMILGRHVRIRTERPSPDIRFEVG